jgi:hypothetical protein
VTGARVAGHGGPVSSGLFPRPAVRQASPGAPRPREGQRDHRCAGVTMPAVATTAASDGPRADARSCRIESVASTHILHYLAFFVHS